MYGHMDASGFATVMLKAQFHEAMIRYHFHRLIFAQEGSDCNPKTTTLQRGHGIFACQHWLRDQTKNSAMLGAKLGLGCA